MRTRIVTVGLIFAALLLVFTPSCSSPSSDEQTTQAPSAKPTLEEVVEIIVSDFGVEDGFTAVAKAFDGGYSFAQIVEGAMAAQISLSGEIEEVSPEFEASDLFVSLANPQVHVVFAKSDPVVFNKTFEIAELRSSLADFSEESNISIVDGPTFLLLQLVREGYSPDQIQEAIVFGYSIKEDCDYRGGNCDRYLADEQDQKVRPARKENRSAVATKDSDTGDPPEENPEVEDADLADEYFGSGTVVLSTKTKENSCSGNAEATLSTNQGGTPELVINYDKVTSGYEASGEGLYWICQSGGLEQSLTLSGTVTGGSFTFNEGGFITGEISGTFNKESGQLSGVVKGGSNQFDFEFESLTAK